MLLEGREEVLGTPAGCWSKVLAMRASSGLGVSAIRQPPEKWFLLLKSDR
jgi:hypothetical protein